MRDAVGEELERRWSEPWPWRSALIAALALHAAITALFTIAPAHRPRSLQLPSVQVRMVAPLAVPTGRAPAGPASQPVRAAPPAPQKLAPVSKPPVRPPAAPARAAVNPATAQPPAPAPASPVSAGEVPAAAASGGGANGLAGVEPGTLRPPMGAVGLGSGNGTAEEPFLFTYYLSRFVGVVESNWFRPPAPAETRCRVRCRIDRSGRLLEAGIEEESVVAAFDRAALRAIFAAAPFPPLPQGFSGQSLTLHLDFGPQ